MKIDVANPKVTNQVKASIFWGFYEGAEMRFVRKYLPKNLDVVELGGSIGVISSLIGKTMGPGKRLHVVEADDKLIPSIRINVSLNNPDVDFGVIHGAISYTHSGAETTTRFYSSEHNTGGNKYGSHNGAKEQFAIDVPVLSLSEVLIRQGVDRFSLVSDIEGAEAEILNHDSGSLAKCDFMVIELHDTESEGHCIRIQEMLSSLKKLGFRELDSDGAAVFVLAR